MRKVGLSLLIAFSCALPAQAALITYEIKDVQDSASYTDHDVSKTFAGTGFVGMYNVVAEGTESFAHLFGLESDDYSRTNMQVDISALNGATINSAALLFTILHGSAGPQEFEGTAYSSTGDLGYLWDAPGISYGSFSGLAVNGPNGYDVTALLAASVLAGDSFFGLHLAGTGSEFLWTYTGLGADADNALVRLEVNYTPAIPEPTTVALLGAGLLALAATRRRKS